MGNGCKPIYAPRVKVIKLLAEAARGWYIVHCTFPDLPPSYSTVDTDSGPVSWNRKVARKRRSRSPPGDWSKREDEDPTTRYSTRTLHYACRAVRAAGWMEHDRG